MEVSRCCWRACVHRLVDFHAAEPFRLCPLTWWWYSTQVITMCNPLLVSGGSKRRRTEQQHWTYGKGLVGK